MPSNTRFTSTRPSGFGGVLQGEEEQRAQGDAEEEEAVHEQVRPRPLVVIGVVANDADHGGHHAHPRSRSW
jgi:hypothetical protein